MWLTATLLVCAVGADTPAAEQVKLLTTFRQEFVDIRPGDKLYPREFVMGSADSPSAKPTRTVKMSEHPFAIAKYEVPQNLYESLLGRNPSRWPGSRNSVEMVSYDDALEFCDKATKALIAAKLITAQQRIRLPSEAEWEYCCRAATTTKYSFGDDAAQLKEYAWFHGNAAGNDPPVGAKQANAWGLFDLHGYVCEWCADPWHDNYDGAPLDNAVWAENGDDRKRAVRGGSWKDPAEHCTSSFRRPVARNTRDDAIGFRCVLSE